MKTNDTVEKVPNRSRDREVAGQPEWRPSERSPKRRLVFAAVAAVALVAVIVFTRIASSDSAPSKTVRVERGTIERRLLLEGRATPSQTFALSFPVPSSDDRVGPTIEEILVKAGDRVGAGAILARLEGDRVESALIRSPAEGVVVEVRGAAGAPPPPGAVIVVRTVDLDAEFDLTESNLTELSEGMEATLTVPVLSKSIPVTIGRLPQDPKTAGGLGSSIGSAQGGAAQSGPEQALNYPLEIPLPPIEGLRPGMTVDLDVLVARKADVLVVPQEALKYDEGGVYVEVAEGNTVRTVRIKTGLSDENSVEVIEGLSEGQTVVIDSQSKS